MKKNKIFTVLILLSIIATSLVYPYLPDKVAIHWNIEGNPDKISNKIFVFITALLPMIILFLREKMPKLDPKKESYIKHEKSYYITTSIIVIFFIIIHWITIGIALGIPISIGKIVPILTGSMLIIFGNYMSQVRPNFFFGIRTPWALSNEYVWRKTQRFGGYSFIVSGIIIISSTLLTQKISFILIIISIFGVSIASYIFSYLQYKKVCK